MRITRVLAGSAAVITAVAGVSLAAAGPAAAVSAWRPFGNTNPVTSSSSEWACAPSQQIAVNVVAQVCAVRGFGAVQAAVIVRNNKPVTYNVSATMDLYDTAMKKTLGSYGCGLSGVAANSWSVCFGSSNGFAADPVESTGFANSVQLHTSPTI
jgi:O-glycosyl hydrolase